MRKLLDLINSFSSGRIKKKKHKNSVAFLYTSNEHAEKAIRKTIPFTITFKTTWE
jgi:hypothetical protein